IFKLYKKQFILRNFLYHILIAGLVYSLVYTKSFLDAGGKFNIIFFALKTIKYRVVHNITSFPGASLFLFLTGYFQTWWGVRGFLKANVWSPIWTFGFFVILAKLKEIIKKGKIDSTNLFPIFVLLYFTYLGIQAPFTRYFLIILPFFYLTLSEFIVTKLIKASEI
ncbi:hypothetical protein HY357_01510, partial [Candidatus Roizmanbacteria bacterium]|nr:hypothetical protein [Candidatus Roizmanbacteria bacterium]